MLTKNDEWWADLTVTQKERIATKVNAQSHPDQPIENIPYPACTTWWNKQTAEQKQQIHDQYIK